MICRLVFRIGVCSLISFTAIPASSIPLIFSYQGIVSDASNVPRPDGDHVFEFSIYGDSAGGTALWTETKNLTTQAGLFATGLGDAVQLDLPFDMPYWLGIRVDTETEMTPRVRMTGVGTAVRSRYADSATSSALADSASKAAMTNYADSSRIAYKSIIADSSRITYKSIIADSTLAINAAAIHVGTIALARLPTGSTASTVSLGNHSHRLPPDSISGLRQFVDSTVFGVTKQMNAYQLVDTNESKIAATITVSPATAGFVLISANWTVRQTSPSDGCNISICLEKGNGTVLTQSSFSGANVSDDIPGALTFMCPVVAGANVFNLNFKSGYGTGKTANPKCGPSFKTANVNLNALYFHTLK